MTHRLYGSRWHGIAIGLLSTFAGLAAAEFVVGLFRGATSPVVPVGQEVIDRVPASVERWAIEWFGTADKAVLILGTLLSLAVIGAIVGNLAVKGNRASAYAVTAVVGVVGVFAVTMRPAPGFGKLMPPIVGTLVSVVVIWFLAPRDIGVLERPIAPWDESVDELSETASTAVQATMEAAVEVPVESSGFATPLLRRNFLQGAASVGVVSVFIGGIGRALKTRFKIDGERAALELPTPVDTIAPPTTTINPLGDPANIDAAPVVADTMDFGIEGTSPFVVPNDDFYRIDTALVVPQVPISSWRLKIHGMVDRELEIDFADLLARPMIERYVTLSCVSNEVGGGLVGNSLFQGVLLKDILDEAGVDPAADQVISRSIDGWNCGTPTEAIMDGRDSMLAIAMNGEPLPAEHGYPVRMVVPGLFGYVSATKWVVDIELARWDDFDGYWVPRGWAKRGPVKTMARIDRPSRGRTLAPTGSGVVDIAGLAWAVHRGLSKVEVQIDDGEWLDCELAAVPSDDTWRQWRYRWMDATPGEHVVRARAYDGSGEPQPAEPKSVAPDGAQGYHTVGFKVDQNRSVTG
jgi:DMSO/TMAO reductase YedYZ molybdopterin-dependent catalytic subunit